uniref:Fifth stage nymph cuticle protein NCP-62 n=1 Tax=Locusta migratoria TaxID=7004 RepID=Q7M481_LOCMI|nr:NCP-62 protein [Locusta migratoria]prf//2005231A cuticle protein [Locusta migratoria]
TSVPASTSLVRESTIVSPYVPSYVAPVVPSTVVASGVVPATGVKGVDVKTVVPFPYTYQSVYPGVYSAGVYPAGVYPTGVYGTGYPIY